jgi:polysaccharide export outer membrane protein
MRKCLARVTAASVLCALALVSPAAAAPPIAEKGPDPSTVGDYRIGVGDVLNIQVWKEVDLTRSVPVRPDGKISFPLLDDLQAAGLTPLELKVVLTERLKQYLSEPRVTVLVEEVNSYKVYVMGEVVTQGALILKNKTDLLQVISLAGGFTAFAKKKEIIIIRNNGKSGARITVNYEKILNGKNPEQNLVLEPGDTVVVQ